VAAPRRREERRDQEAAEERGHDSDVTLAGGECREGERCISTMIALTHEGRDAARAGSGQKGRAALNIDDFMTRVSGEPEQTIARTIWVTPRETLARAEKPGGLKVTDFLSAPGRRAEQKVIRYRHILGPPASRLSR
jgi:hypothetical protein